MMRLAKLLLALLLVPLLLGVGLARCAVDLWRLRKGPAR